MSSLLQLPGFSVREGGRSGGHGVQRAQDLSPMLTFRQHLRPGWEAGGERQHQPLSRIPAAESAAVKPDLSEVKGTCGNPPPAKGESSGSRWASGGSPLKCQSSKDPKLTGTLFSRFSPQGGTAPGNDQVSSWSGVLHLLGPCGIAGRWCLLQSGLGAQLGVPSGFRSCPGGHPAA